MTEILCIMLVCQFASIGVEACTWYYFRRKLDISKAHLDRMIKAHQFSTERKWNTNADALKAFRDNHEMLKKEVDSMKSAATLRSAFK